MTSSLHLHHLLLLLILSMHHSSSSPTTSCGFSFSSLPMSPQVLGTLSSRPSLFRSSSLLMSFSVGAETMDRGFTNFSSFSSYLGPLGVTHARIQCGWQKCDPKGDGNFDFDWLDVIISNMLDQGVIPWLQLSFGNSAYIGGGNAEVSSPLPNSTVALNAWDKWVTALITRYSSKAFIGEGIITEIWNEPNIQHISANDYADFTIRTATIVKSIASQAQVRFGVVAGYDSTYIRTLAERIVNVTGSSTTSLVDVLTYHPYDYNPDSSYIGIKSMYAQLQTILPRVTIMQGENGAPSIGGGYGALTDYNWTECSQAKYFARRLIRDASNGIPSSAFSIVDLCYESSGGEITVNHKGLLLANCSNASFPVLRPKESYTTVSHVTSTLDASILTPLLEPATYVNVTALCQGTGAKEIKSLFVGAWQSTRDPSQVILALWNSSGTPISAEDSTTVLCNLTVMIDSSSINLFSQPQNALSYIGIDIISGVAFNVTSNSLDNLIEDTDNIDLVRIASPRNASSSFPSLFSSSWTFTNVPISDSPLVLFPVNFPILLVSPPSSSMTLPVPSDVLSVVESLIENFQERHYHTGDAHWERAAYFFGHTAARSLPLSNVTSFLHQSYAIAYGTTNSWGCNGSMWPGDLGIAWTIDDLVTRGVVSETTLQPIATVMDEFINASPPLRYVWSWVDTLAYNLPEWLSFASSLSKPQYKSFAESQWRDVKYGVAGNASAPGLWNQDFGLWFRDKSFINKTAPNGKFIFWGRGNSWAAIALVRALERDTLPQGDPFRTELEDTLKAMASAYAPLQGVDGLWRSNLMDADAIPNPETTASVGPTALLAYGVRSGLLDTDFYLPRITSAWAGLMNISITKDGAHASFCQPVGAAPAPADETDESDFCLGLLLVAAGQVYLLSEQMQLETSTSTSLNPSSSLSSFSYNRSGALAYAHRYYNTTNHDCSTAYTACSPFSYWGDESCGYSSHGGDCADFVSQCLLAGNHTPLVKAPCRGYPCGVEEVGAEKLGACLAANYNWKSTCVPTTGTPPSNLIPGDVVIFHASSCTDEEAHATLIVYVNGPFIGVSAHSNDVYNNSIENYASEFGYMDFLHWEG